MPVLRSREKIPPVPCMSTHPETKPSPRVAVSVGIPISSPLVPSGAGDVTIASGAGSVTVAQGAGLVIIVQDVGSVTIAQGTGSVTIALSVVGVTITQGGGCVTTALSAGPLTVAQGAGGVTVARVLAVSSLQFAGLVTVTQGAVSVTAVHRRCASWVAPAQAAGSAQSSPTHGASRPMPMPVRSTSAGSTPTHVPQDSLTGGGGDVQEAFIQGTRRNLRNDLLVAADSITNTMSSLVKELHSGDIIENTKYLLSKLSTDFITDS
ncbi:hypothetical protein AAES_89381 [Amazona aestiva]|uniref:Uncharacterized protein n=1 Tax=Amazona aestiva TaxID=12930 RepID=A0A0Q3TJN4_AMAAE|nr:hypothetical protein AAES_89381 [Amazona aestiva]